MSEDLSIDFDLDSLLTTDQLSLDEERNSSLAVSEYLINNSDINEIDFSSYKRTIKIDIHDLIKHEEINFKKMSNDELFNILNSKTLVTNPQLHFPKVKHINDVFWFLNNLGSLELENTKFLIDKNLSEPEAILIDSAIFFGFFSIVEEDNLFLVPTDLFNLFGEKNTEQRYIFFLKNIGANKTTRDCINIQLSDPIYDRLSKQMVFNKLKENHNIIEEDLNNNEISKIVNNVRYWFLDIKKYLL